MRVNGPQKTKVLQEVMLPLGRRRANLFAGEIYKKNKNTPLLATGIFIL